MSKLPNAVTRRGASMGRPSSPPDPNYKGVMRLERIRLDSGGYDSGGAYWGHGEPLYRAYSLGETLPSTGEFPEFWFRLDPEKRTALANTMRANGDDPLEYGARALDRRTAKAQVWEAYPLVRFLR
jgi:hypothetical protein